MDWLIFDASVVRGLSYYTGIIFECFERVGIGLRAICGGGRYDNLLSMYGSEKCIPAIGFGFGDCVIIELLSELNLLPNLPSIIDDLIIPFDNLRETACLIATRLRACGRSVDIYLNKTNKITKCFSYADRRGAKRVILVAPDEIINGYVRFKLLRINDDLKEFNVPLMNLEFWSLILRYQCYFYHQYQNVQCCIAHNE